ncbi:MAG: DUF1214 domain-containing protein [Bacteroidota bacterium]
MKKLLFAYLTALKRFKRWRLSLQGKTFDDLDDQAIVTGKAWEEFCDNLKAAGAALINGNAPKDPFNQAEGYKYLMRLTRVGLDYFVEYANPGFPALKRLVHETVKIGADNPDNYYQNAMISGDYEYRITGRRNTIPFLTFHTLDGQFASPEGVHPCGNLSVEELNLEDDGSFEIILSKTKKGKNWLPISDQTAMLIVRQTFQHRDQEQVAEVQLECLNGPKVPPPVTASSIVRALDIAGLFVGGTALQFSNWSNSFTKHSNQLPELDPKLADGAGGDDRLVYYHSHYKLADDECLVIETPVPKCDYWNFQVNNYWMESLDYRYEKIHVNNATAQYNADGSVTVIVAKQAIDHPNYLTTQGHNQGTMLWRWLLPDQKIQPKCRVAKINDFMSK